MAINELEKLSKEYFMLLNSQKFNHAELDYSVAENFKPFLLQLSQVANSAITVFDMYKKQHIYASYNFETMFGYDVEQLQGTNGTSYYDTKIHPEDLLSLMRNGVEVLKVYFELPKEKQAALKLISEYRILNSHQKYIRIVEQQQVLSFDPSHNVWLSLSVTDISPYQDIETGLKSQLINFKTGQLISSFQEEVKTPTKLLPKNQNILTTRETEILHLIRNGQLSKEISEQLSISLHTVNTHRQRILEKLNANNSMEAIQYAGKLGLLM
jgi:DNA-binding CsgD family transcriptional regulator